MRSMHESTKLKLGCLSQNNFMMTQVGTLLLDRASKIMRDNQKSRSQCSQNWIILHNVKVVFFQPCAVVILTCSRLTLRGTQVLYSFFAWFCGFVRSYVRFVFTNRTSLVQNPSLFTRTCHLHMHIQSSARQPTCLYTRQVIQLNLAFSRAKVSHVQRRIQHYLGSILTWLIYLDVIPRHRVPSAITTHSIMLSRIGPFIA